MAFLMPSASSIQRVMECPSSHVLPQIKSSSEAAERGTAIHAFLEQIVSEIGRAHV